MADISFSDMTPFQRVGGSRRFETRFFLNIFSSENGPLRYFEKL